MVDENVSEKVAFVVLGMHRSGTSAVAGSLAKLGASPPTRLMPAKADNPLGFWESEKIVEFNDEILCAAGSSWLDWGPLNANVFSGRFGGHFVSAAKWLLSVEFGEAETIVLKDPRICRFYPFWRSSLQRYGFKPIVIIPVRSPERVANSLQKRNGTSLALGMRLWLRHVLDAEHSSRGDPRTVVTLDDLIAQRFERFSGIMHLANRPISHEVSGFEVIKEFWDRDTNPLASEDHNDIPGLVHRTWEAFQLLSSDGDSPESAERFDRLRSEFESLCSLFYDPPKLQ